MQTSHNFQSIYIYKVRNTYNRFYVVWQFPDYSIQALNVFALLGSNRKGEQTYNSFWSSNFLLENAKLTCCTNRNYRKAFDAEIIRHNKNIK